jgi:riboflavin kinase/FMN adenylyltransferase
MALARLHSAEEWITRFGEARARTAVAIGNFDGVHLGHQRILRGVIERARSGDVHDGDRVMASVLTFYPHPARVLRPTAAPALLATLEQRLEAFDAIGLDAALVLRFDEALSKLGAEEFARRFLVETLRAKAVLVGGNFRFGHRQAGDVKLLMAIGAECGFEVCVVEPVRVDGEIVSSSAIRQAVSDGRMEDAANFLGRAFSLEGEIRPGTGTGRKVVVPTLNLTTEQELLPKNGVYATETILSGRRFPSATNIGVRPTFDGTRMAIESHLFDFSEQLTSGKMEVRFRMRLRDEKKFESVDALREQVMRDIARAREYFRDGELRTGKSS